MLWMFKGAMTHLVSEARDLPPRVGVVSTHPGGTWNVEMSTVSSLVRAAFMAVRTLYVSVFHLVFRLYFTCCMSALFKPSHDFTCLRRLIPFTSEVCRISLPL